MFPPHLPPPTCSIPRHRQWQRIKYLLVATFFGIFAGISGAAVMLGFVWPSFNDGVNWLVARNPLTISRNDLQSRAESKMVDKVFTVYKKSSWLGNAQYFSPSDKLGDAVVVVNSGWVVMHLPAFDNRSKEWLAVASDGSVFRFGTLLTDKRAGLLYGLLVPVNSSVAHTQEQFKVATFNVAVDRYDDLFVYQDGQWLQTVNFGLVPAFSGERHLDGVDPFVYNISDSFKNGSIVIDAAGNLVGFVADNTAVLPLWNASYYLNGIAERQKITYQSLGVEGWYSSEKLIIINDEKISGFIVDAAVGNKSLWQRGDIISSVNGKPLNFDTLWYTTVGQVLRVQVLRAGKVLELSVPVLELAS